MKANLQLGDCFMDLFSNRDKNKQTDMDYLKNILFESNNKHVYFIGIGGISMSGLAEILLNLGYKVSGSEIVPSNITKKLEEKGAKIYYNHKEENINDVPDLVVYTAAIKSDNPELMKASSYNIPIIDRATLLGLIMRRYPYSIAISGTHGKTTTTSMIAMIMLESGLDPTIHIGGELSYIGGTTRIGNSSYFVTEADEYCESFLKLQPYIGVILNIEFDHPDYYKDLEHIKNSFKKFAQLVPKNGYVIICTDNVNSCSILHDIEANIITYGIDNNEDTKKYTFTAKDAILNKESGCASYTLLKNGLPLDIIELKVAGIHNVYNSLAAIAACYQLGCGIERAKQALLKFKGVHRRFELKGISDNIRVIDDYAHHPSEIRATLKTAKFNNNGRIWCVFQPHTFSRTKYLLDDFASALSDADTVILADIFAAREISNGDINSKLLAEKINRNGGNAIYIPEFEAICHYLRNNAMPGDLIITMGAGDIYKVGDMFLNG